MLCPPHFCFLQIAGEIFYERNFYEGEAGAAAAALDGAAQRGLHAGEQPLQHRGQPVCGAHQRGCHDRFKSGVPHPELFQRHCHWLWHRHQRHDRAVSGRGRPRKGRDCRHPRLCAQPCARRCDDGGQHRHHARLSAPLYAGRDADRRRHHLLYHCVPVFGREHGLAGL